MVMIEILYVVSGPADSALYSQFTASLTTLKKMNL